MLPVIHPGAAEGFFLEGKAEWLHEMEAGSRGEAEAGDVPGIRGDFRFDEDDVEHARLFTEEAAHPEVGIIPGVDGTEDAGFVDHEHGGELVDAQRAREAALPTKTVKGRRPGFDLQVLEAAEEVAAAFVEGDGGDAQVLLREFGEAPAETGQPEHAVRGLGGPEDQHDHVAPLGRDVEGTALDRVELEFEGFVEEGEAKQVVGDPPVQGVFAGEFAGLVEQLTFQRGVVIADGGDFDQQARAAAVAGIAGNEVARGIDDRAAHFHFAAAHALQVERDAPESRIGALFRRDVPELFQFRELPHGLVDRSLEAVHVAEGRLDIGQAHSGVELARVGGVPGNERLEKAGLGLQVLAGDRLCFLAAARALPRAGIHRLNRLPIRIGRSGCDAWHGGEHSCGQPRSEEPWEHVRLGKPADQAGLWGCFSAGSLIAMSAEDLWISFSNSSRAFLNSPKL